MADITVDNDVGFDFTIEQQPRSLVWTDKDTGYVFFIDSTDNAVKYRKSADAGSTWGSQIVIDSTVVGNKLAIWYDKWTSGDTGTLVHLSYIDTFGDSLFYKSLDTDGDGLSPSFTVFEDLESNDGNWVENGVSVVKSRGGNLYAGGWISDIGNGFFRSTDVGSNWTSRTNVVDGDEVDRIQFLPGSGTDNQDIWCVYQDVSANELSLKVHDDSANTWNETSISTGIVENNSFFQFDACHRHSDDHSVLIAWTSHISSTGSIQTWDLAGSNQVTSGGNVITGDSAHAMQGILINQQNDDLYAAYSSATTVGSVVYKKSTDGGLTWGTETAMSETSDDHKVVLGGTSVDSNGGRWQPIWFNDDLQDLITNKLNSVEIAASVVAAGTQYGYSDPLISINYVA